MEKVNVDALIVMLPDESKKKARELVIRLTVPKDDLPADKETTNDVLVEKHGDYICTLMDIHARKQWPKDFTHYGNRFEFYTVQVTPVQ